MRHGMVSSSLLGLLLLFSSIGGLLLKGARRDQRSMASEAAALRLTSERRTLKRRCNGSRDGANPGGNPERLEQALVMVAHDVPADLLLADSSLATSRRCSRRAPVSKVHVRSRHERLSGLRRRTARLSRTTPSSILSVSRDAPAWTCVPVSIAVRRRVFRAKGP